VGKPGNLQGVQKVLRLIAHQERDQIHHPNSAAEHREGNPFLENVEWSETPPITSSTPGVMADEP